MRDLILDIRAEEGDTLEELAYLGISSVCNSLMVVWASGKPCPDPNAWVEKTKVVSETGEFLGFNYYLVWGDGESKAIGVRTEVETSNVDGDMP